MTWRKSVVISGHSAPIYACTVFNEFIYSTAGDRFVTRWNTADGKQDAFTVKLDAPAYTLGIVESERLLIIGCTNGTIIAIHTDSKQLVWEHNFLGKALFSAVDCPAEKWLVLGDAEGHLLVLDYTGKLLTTFHLDCGKIRSIKHTKTGLFIGCQDGSWRQLELPTFNEIRKQQAHEGGVVSLSINEFTHTLLSGGKDAHLRLWDMLTGKLLQEWPAHYQTIYGIAQCGDEIITVSMDKTIKIWDSTEWKVTQRIEFKQGGHNRSVNGCLAIDQNRFLTFSDDKSILIFECKMEN
ncbi:MAG: hypothetical protein QE487_06545 [Fluviicola sp.]|nr:hypothetical protein [Fluviicola sp.]